MAAPSLPAPVAQLVAQGSAAVVERLLHARASDKTTVAVLRAVVQCPAPFVDGVLRGLAGAGRFATMVELAKCFEPRLDLSDYLEDVVAAICAGGGTNADLHILGKTKLPAEVQAQLSGALQQLPVDRALLMLTECKSIPESATVDGLCALFQRIGTSQKSQGDMLHFGMGMRALPREVIVAFLKELFQVDRHRLIAMGIVVALKLSDHFPEVPKAHLQLPSHVKIRQVDSAETLQFARDALRGVRMLGLDQETQPCFTKGTFHPVSILQVATPQHVLIFDLLKFHGAEVLDLLGAVLADPAVIKLGQGFQEDLRLLHRSYPHHGFMQIHSFIDRQSISLKNMVACVLGQVLDKGQQMSRWQRRPLHEPQLKYAALDAHVLVTIAEQLEKRLAHEGSSADAKMRGLTAAGAALSRFAHTVHVKLKPAKQPHPANAAAAEVKPGRVNKDPKPKAVPAAAVEDATVALATKFTSVSTVPTTLPGASSAPPPKEGAVHKGKDGRAKKIKLVTSHAQEAPKDEEGMEGGGDADGARMESTPTLTKARRKPRRRVSQS